MRRLDAEAADAVGHALAEQDVGILPYVRGRLRRATHADDVDRHARRRLALWVQHAARYRHPTRIAVQRRRCRASPFGDAKPSVRGVGCWHFHWFILHGQ